MKKYFIFAAIATAGLFASCSSSDDAISENPNSPIENGDRTAIKIGVGSPGAVTRGTGTVGGVGTDDAAKDYIANAWHGQVINVFMFDKGTLDLSLENSEDATSTFFNNTAMYTPGSTDNVIPSMDTPKEKGEAMITTGAIKYYPVSGNFDFFGYHGDDAIAETPAITKTDNLWTVPFTIDGSQDLMSTKAAPVTGDDATIVESKDFYSAKAARKGVHPTLTFKHLLTRLSFVAIAGNDAAAGWVDGTDDVVSTVSAADYEELDDDAKDQCVAKTYKVKATPGTLTDDQFNELTSEQKEYFDGTADAHAVVSADLELTKAEYDALYAKTNAVAGIFEIKEYTRTIPGTAGHADATKAVKINSIKVKSKKTGNLVVAWLNPDGDDPVVSSDADKISFGDAPADWLTLKERPAYKFKSDADAIEDADIEGNGDMTEAELTAAKALAGETISANVYTTVLSAAGKNKYEAVTNAEKELLTTLTPTSPSIDGDKATAALGRYPETPIGEALIVAPKSELQENSESDYEGYEMEVSLSQYVKSNWKPTPDGTYETKSQTAKYTIAAPSNATIDHDGDGEPDGAGAQKGFLQNVSYKVKLTVYGWERIVVTAEVEPWIDGEDIPVGQD